MSKSRCAPNSWPTPGLMAGPSNCHTGTFRNHTRRGGGHRQGCLPKFAQIWSLLGPRSPPKKPMDLTHVQFENRSRATRRRFVQSFAVPDEAVQFQQSWGTLRRVTWFGLSPPSSSSSSTNMYMKMCMCLCMCICMCAHVYMFMTFHIGFMFLLHLAYIYIYIYGIINRQRRHNIRNGNVWATTSHNTSTCRATLCVIEL